MRTTLRELLMVTFMAAFGCAALAQNNFLLSCLFWSFTLGVFLAATLCAIAHSGERRWFWIGFSLCGCVYLAHTHDSQYREILPQRDGPLITTQLLRFAYSRLHPDELQNPFSQGGVFSIDSEDRDGKDGGGKGEWKTVDASGNLSLVLGSGQTIHEELPPDAFMRSGHCLWALLLGWLGGHFTRFVKRRSKRIDSA